VVALSGEMYYFHKKNCGHILHRTYMFITSDVLVMHLASFHNPQLNLEWFAVYYMQVDTAVLGSETAVQQA
jgi:hypothetical protein